MGNHEVRTSDNVKLRLEGQIFWKIIDVRRLIDATDDPAGDVWQHARSALIQAVSDQPLNAFMAGFNAIVMQAFRTQATDGVYSERGVQVVSMELTRYEPMDRKTADTLQQIIQETTNRINKLQAQESENEVKAAKLRSDIKLESQRKELIEAQSENARLEAEMTGQSDGTKLVERAATFISGLADALPDVDSRV